jgi:hypothetical protein
MPDTVRTTCTRAAGLATALAILASPLLGAQALALGTSNIVKNGSLENLEGKWTNTRCNYMAVTAGSKAITGWKVTTSAGELAWAKAPTCDGFRASNRKFFVDLTGFGSDAPNGALQQQLNTSAGQRYQFSIDVCTCNDASPAVTVGKNTLSLTPGPPFSVGNASWRRLTGTFTGTSRNKAPKLKIMNATRGAQIVLIDHVVVKRQ